MKATGIIRRMDDLGRVVIPKEIRRTLRIREGEALEIYTDIVNGNPCVCFCKYEKESPLSGIQDMYMKPATMETLKSPQFCAEPKRS